MLITRDPEGHWTIKLTDPEAEDLTHFVFTKHDGDDDCEEWPDVMLLASNMVDVYLSQTGKHMDGIFFLEDDDGT